MRIDGVCCNGDYYIQSPRRNFSEIRHTDNAVPQQSRLLNCLFLLFPIITAALDAILTWDINMLPKGYQISIHSVHVMYWRTQIWNLNVHFALATNITDINNSQFELKNSRQLKQQTIQLYICSDKQRLKIFTGDDLFGWYTTYCPRHMIDSEKKTSFI